MRAFGFLSFGHYGNSFGSQARTAADMIRQAGFGRVQFRNMSMGIAALHSGWKI